MRKRPYTNPSPQPLRTKECTVVLNDVTKSLASATSARQIEMLEDLNAIKLRFEKLERVIEQLSPLSVLINPSEDASIYSLEAAAQLLDKISTELTLRIRTRKQLVVYNVPETTHLSVIKQGICNLLPTKQGLLSCKRLRKQSIVNICPILLEFSNEDLAKYFKNLNLKSTQLRFLNKAKIVNARTPLQREVAKHRKEIRSLTKSSPVANPQGNKIKGDNPSTQSIVQQASTPPLGNSPCFGVDLDGTPTRSPWHSLDTGSSSRLSSMESPRKFSQIANSASTLMTKICQPIYEPTTRHLGTKLTLKPTSGTRSAKTTHATTNEHSSSCIESNMPTTSRAPYVPCLVCCPKPASGMKNNRMQCSQAKITPQQNNRGLPSNCKLKRHRSAATISLGLPTHSPLPTINIHKPTAPINTPLSQMTGALRLGTTGSSQEHEPTYFAQNDTWAIRSHKSKLERKPHGPAIKRNPHYQQPVSKACQCSILGSPPSKFPSIYDSMPSSRLPHRSSNNSHSTSPPRSSVQATRIPENVTKHNTRHNVNRAAHSNSFLVRRAAAQRPPPLIPPQTSYPEAPLQGNLLPSLLWKTIAIPLLSALLMHHAPPTL